MDLPAPFGPRTTQFSPSRMRQLEVAQHAAALDEDVAAGSRREGAASRWGAGTGAAEGRGDATPAATAARTSSRGPWADDAPALEDARRGVTSGTTSSSRWVASTMGVPDRAMPEITSRSGAAGGVVEPVARTRRGGARAAAGRGRGRAGPRGPRRSRPRPGCARPEVPSPEQLDGLVHAPLRVRRRAAARPDTVGEAAPDHVLDADVPLPPQVGVLGLGGDEARCARARRWGSRMAPVEGGRCAGRGSPGGARPRPRRSRRSVLLPAPLPPRIAQLSPSRRVKEIARGGSRAPEPDVDVVEGDEGSAQADWSCPRPGRRKASGDAGYNGARGGAHRRVRPAAAAERGPGLARPRRPTPARAAALAGARRPRDLPRGACGPRW